MDRPFVTVRNPIEIKHTATELDFSVDLFVGKEHKAILSFNAVWAFDSNASVTQVRIKIPPTKLEYTDKVYVRNKDWTTATMDLLKRHNLDNIIAAYDAYGLVGYVRELEK